ncbi:probable ribosome biogenesis protein RLP24 [Papaver somniferum]|uniref:probable ribosome biogenesis protein RLP24 n=1 Tax=Papaver somniferum TaxID=3469 RepID=UPI000E703CD4|nr:probable ribosome biogenesis protein RLP24 [Papaver somniferum]
MTKDSTFEFERKRNRPERYDRIRIQKTLEVMKEIVNIRQAREIAHHKQRMKGNKSKMIKVERKELDDQRVPILKPVGVQTPPKIKVQIQKNQIHAMEE